MRSHRSTDYAVFSQNSFQIVCIEAGEGRWGTDEIAFNEVLAKRNYKQLQATFQAYQIVSNEVLRGEGSLRNSPKLFPKEAKTWDTELENHIQ